MSPLFLQVIIMADVKITFDQANIDPQSFNVTNKTLQQIEKHLFESSLPVLIREKNQNLTQIQIEAKRYLTFLNQGFVQLQKVFKEQGFLKQHYFNVLQARVHSATEFAKLEEQYYRSLIYLKEYMINIALWTEVFSTVCQRELGYETSVLYVPDQNQPVIYKLKSLQDLIQQGHLTRTRLQKTESQMEQLVKQSNGQIERINVQKKLGIQQAMYLDTAYSKIIERYETYRYTSKKGKGTISLILWNLKAGTPSDKWMGMKLTNKGDLAQTYANIVFQRKSIFSGVQSPQKDINVFMWRVTQVDSVSGLLQGDFIIGNQSFSVKSGNASVQGIVTAMNLAKDLLTITEPAKIKNLLEQRKYDLAYNKEGNRSGLRNWVKNVSVQSFGEAFGHGIKRK